eukprot:941963-Lingulodinium_polyedra.AAC.1
MSAKAARNRHESNASDPSSTEAYTMHHVIPRAWCVCVVIRIVEAAQSAFDRIVAQHSSACCARCSQTR